MGRGNLEYDCPYHGYDWPTKLFSLRLDHIMYDDKFDLCEIRVIHSHYSDHDALVGLFNLKER